MFSKKDFSERLKALRISRGAKQSDLAIVAGVQHTAISMMESGDRGPSVEVLYALCQYFNVSADYLLGLSDDPERR